MGYPGQKYRQEQAGKPLPGQGPPNQNQNPSGYGAMPPPNGQYGGQPGYGQPPPQGYNQGYNNPPPQSYNQGQYAPPGQNFNQYGGSGNQGYGQPNLNFPQSNPSFPMGGMSMPGGNIPMPGGSMPMPGGNMPMPGGNMPGPGPPPFGNQPSGNGYNQQGFPQPVQNHQYQEIRPPSFNTPNYGGNGQQHSFNPPPQPPPQDQAKFNQPPPVQQLPQSQPLPPGAGGSVQVSNFSGRKKALLIGINYFGTSAALRGCINDVKNVKEFISRHYNFSEESMIILTDDQKHDPSRMPTRQNITQAMRWLVSDARPNDSLFFHFSGHGSQQEDKDGDEADGYDETICPLDYDKAGMIVDDEMNSIMVQSLPQGCRLTAIFDCCHSGTALDLPYTYDKHGKLISYSPSKTVKNVAVDIGKKYLMGDMVGALQSLKTGVSSFKSGKKAEKVSQETRGTLADVVMFSGCEDSQTSADAVEQGVGNTGAMSYALIKSLSNNPHNLSYLQLLAEVRGILQGKYTQVPQLSSGRPMDMSQCFNM